MTLTASQIDQAKPKDKPYQLTDMPGLHSFHCSPALIVSIAYLFIVRLHRQMHGKEVLPFLHSTVCHTPCAMLHTR